MTTATQAPELFAIFKHGESDPIWASVTTTEHAEEKAVVAAVNHGNVELLSGRDLALRLSPFKPGPYQPGSTGETDAAGRMVWRWSDAPTLKIDRGDREPELHICRACGRAIYLHHRSDNPQVAGTGPGFTEHWRHVDGDDRHCERGNGAIAEPYNGSGPIAEMLRSCSWQPRRDGREPAQGAAAN